MRKKVLVVDDEPQIVEDIKLSLEESGYSVLTAGNGLDALQISRNEKPHLIVFDVMMPQMSGLQFMEKLKDIQPEIGYVPLIVISSRASMGDFFSPSDILGFLTKPFHTAKLVETVLKAIGTPLLKEMPDLQKAVPIAPPVEKKETPAVKPATPPPPVQKAEPPPPARKPDGKITGKAIVVGVEENKVRKIKRHLESIGWTVEYAMDESDTLEIMEEFSPDAIFCQYWEDASTLDAVEIQKAVTSKSKNSLQVTIFCSPELSVEASKHFPASHVLTYSGMDELLQKIAQSLSRK